MTLFAAVDSETENHYIDVMINDDGTISWTHTSSTTDGYGAPKTITSPNSYAGAGEVFHHLALVYDDSSNDMSMFVDGYIVATGTASGAVQDSVEIVMGKKGPRENSNYYRGYLDDFRIWKAARYWEDLRSYRSITLSGFEDSLAAYWKFDEEAGDKIFDLAVDKYTTSEIIDDETVNYPEGKPYDNDGEVCLVERLSLIHI